MPPSEPFALLARGLEEIGYHEDGETDGVYLFTTYRNRHQVFLHDSEALTLEEQVASLFEQGVDMIALLRAIQELLAESPES